MQHSNQKKSRTILLILGILLGVLVVSLVFKLQKPTIKDVQPTASPTATPTPTVDPRTIQSGVCTATFMGMNTTFYVAGYNNIRIEALDSGLRTYITLYKGRDVYYWNSNSGTKFDYTDVMGFNADMRAQYPGLISITDMQGITGQNCTKTQEIPMGLFEPPRDIIFDDYKP
jgi:hypothetical protein